MTGWPGLGQVHVQRNAVGCMAKLVLLGDDVCTTAGMERELSARVVLIVHTARNRRLRLPPQATGRARPRRYGDRTAPCITFRGQAISHCLTSKKHLWCYHQENRTQQPTLSW